ncbi:MAG: hypothetical protein GXX94_02310 [Chloroflexi bacterium]|nr:hypothetical protein [Chloroflexota bacterium]
MWLLNLGSLALGLVAWLVPAARLIEHSGRDRSRLATQSVASLSACALSLLLQLCYTRHLVKIQDWAALMDTTGAVTAAATILVLFTIALNAAMVLGAAKAGD